MKRRATALALAAAALAATAAGDDMALRVKACTACHGAEGRATREGYFPRIAGKPAGYLYRQLIAFRDGRRRHAPMAALTAYLSDDYLREIAEHFARLDPPYPAPPPLAQPPAEAALGRRLALEGDAAHGLPACADCHGTALTGVAPWRPGLLGLPRDYLVAQIGAWRTGQRRAGTPDCMHAVAERLSPADVQAVTTWLARQPLPAARAPANAPPTVRLPADLACEADGR